MATQPVRIAEDEHGPRADYADIEVGRDLGSLTWTIAPEDIEKQCRIDDDYDEAYQGSSALGEQVAPPQIQYRPPRWLLSRNYNVRGVFHKWEFENLGPLRPGVKIEVSGSITDKYVRRGREFVEFEAVGRDPEGREVFRTRRTHALDMAERSAPRVGRGIDSGIKKERI